MQCTLTQATPDHHQHHDHHHPIHSCATTRAMHLLYSENTHPPMKCQNLSRKLHRTAIHTPGSHAVRHTQAALWCMPQPHREHTPAQPKGTPATPAYSLHSISRTARAHHGGLTRENAGMKEGKRMQPPTTQLGQRPLDTTANGRTDGFERPVLGHRHKPIHSATLQLQGRRLC